MILFMLTAAFILIYGMAYALFCIKKGGIAAALSVFVLLLMDVGILMLLIRFRTNT